MNLKNLLEELQPIASFIVCKKDNKFYATTRIEGGYGFPGGKAEPGETPRQTAIREAKEEGFNPVDVSETPFYSQKVEKYMCYWFFAKTGNIISGNYKEKSRGIKTVLVNKDKLKSFGNDNAINALKNKEL